MNNELFEQIESIIKKRRTTKAHSLNGKIIPDGQIQKLMELADCAPNHGQTEPWRYLIFTGKALQTFGKMHSDIYWKYTDAAKRRESKYNKYISYAKNASHLIISVMHRNPDTKIPEKEERSAVSAANENILLGATALGIASYWSTGGMTYHPALKKHLKLDDDEKIIGMIYLGYTDEPCKKKKRRISLDEKVIWMEKAMMEEAV